jgi:ribosomal-protein-alanine N-acetyltransferase
MQKSPTFILEDMTEEDGQAVCDWRYPPPYERYRWPSWETMVEHKREFGDPEIRKRQYKAVRNEQNELIGYVQFFPLDRTVRVGLGLKPDCCDKGYGPAVIRKAVEEARLRQPAAEIDLEVEQWNRRAIRAYQKAGFVVTDQYERKATHGTVFVFCMVWQPQS